jgi:N-acetylglucosamine kinase-like BadF-type ATPase
MTSASPGARFPAPVSLFLGVDGGGTKTALCLVADDGTVCGSALVGSAYYLGRGDVSLVGEVLTEGVSAICATAGATPADIAFAFVGLPGYGEVSADVPLLNAAPHAALGHDRYRCDNDMVCGWAGSLGGADGINVVGGTGSIAYGEWRGARARAGGWGEVFGDEGSGYWLGVRALQLFSRMSDGRLPAGPLVEEMRRHLALSTDLDLVGVVFARWRAARSSIAALAPVVATAARAGDEHAAALLADAGAELALLVDATRRELVPGGCDDRMPVSFSGGVLNIDEVRYALTERLHSAGRYELRAPRFPPVVGAALLAARLAGMPLDTGALDRLPAAL